MRPNDIVAKLRTQPFRPVRVYISDGLSYDGCHSELMMVGRTEVAIGLSSSGEGLYDRLAYGDPVHITRIVPIDGKRAKRNPKRSR